MFWRVCAAANKWEHALTIAEAMAASFPRDDMWIVNRAHALRKLGRTDEAYSTLNAAVSRARSRRNKWLMRYRLACYACVLGNLTEAQKNFHKAIDLASKHNVQLMALDEPDLQPLLRRIA